jgi:glycosyltransferase involved in cell wall biosynthesis
MKISVIIPAKNEENYLPILLKEIEKQANHELRIETIVAVAPSIDDTIGIARKFGVKAVRGGLPGIGRNAGAKIAKGKIFFFLDADVVLSEDFFRNAVSEFSRKNLDIATAQIKTDSRNIIDRIYFSMHHIAILLSKIIRAPYAPGACMIIKKEKFRKAKGFDESLTFSEDAELTRRIAALGARFGILSSCSAIASNRRFVKEGRAKIAIRFLSTVCKNLLKIKIRQKGYYFVNDEPWNFENWQNKWNGYIASMKKIGNSNGHRVRKIAKGLSTKMLRNRQKYP